MDPALISVLLDHGPLALICGWLLWERRDVTRVLKEHTKVMTEIRTLIQERLEK